MVWGLAATETCKADAKNAGTVARLAPVAACHEMFSVTAALLVRRLH